MSLFSRDPLAEPRTILKRVYAYVAYRIDSEYDAEDVTSDVVERMLRYRDRYDPRAGSPVAWALGIARTAVADFYASRRFPPTDETGDEAGEPALEESAVRRLTLRGALAELSENDRELIALRYGADLPARQIAELLGQRTNTVEVALHRALARLRACLDERTPVRAGGRDTAT